MDKNTSKGKKNKEIVLEILKDHYGKTTGGLTQSEVCKRLAAEKNRMIVGSEEAVKYTAKIVQGGVSRDLRKLEEDGYVRYQGNEWIFLPIDNDGKREQERQLIRELDYHKETIFKFNDDAILLSLKGGLAERARYLFSEYLGDALHDSLVVDGKLILLLEKTVDTKENESAEVAETTITESAEVAETTITESAEVAETTITETAEVAETTITETAEVAETTITETAEVAEAADVAEAAGTIETAEAADDNDDEENPTVKKIKELVKQSYDWHREAEKGKGKVRLKK